MDLEKFHVDLNLVRLRIPVKHLVDLVLRKFNHADERFHQTADQVLEVSSENIRFGFLLTRETPCDSEHVVEVLHPGLDVLGVHLLPTIRPDETPVVLVKFAAKYKSGVVVPEPGAFTTYAWVNAEEVKNYPCIDGVALEVAQTIEAFNGIAKK
jgi:hypothetical protein